MRFRDLREDMDMTQQELASQLNIRQSTLSQYENGQRQIPLNTLIQLALFFEYRSDLIGGDSVDAAAEGDQLYQLHILVLADIFSRPVKT